MATISRGTVLQERRNGVINTVVGFTTKPSSTEPSDGIRRARVTDGSRERRIRVDHIIKTFKPV